MTRILVVEDERVIAAGLRDNLHLEGYEVDLAKDGRTAETRAMENAYDLILLDLMLPGKDGLSVCRDLRAAGIRTPIIILTAKGQEADKVIGLEFGADDFVTKPFSSRELLARIKAVLRRFQDPPAPPLSVFESEGLRVDFQRLEASCNGEEISLTPTEFRLLQVFIQNRGVVLSMDRLIELVWGRDYAQSDRVIYTHVNNLRAKMEKLPGGRHRIRNIRGFGYRFDG
jgi:DNA-binding response OmpR family regulator